VTETLELFAWLCIAHALADYPLQGDWLAKAKNPTIAAVPYETIWPGALLSHAAIHAGAVKIVTGSWALAGAEFLVHTLTDYGKCRGYLTYNGDQAVHVCCKLVWAAIAAQTAVH
jgi:hypothetical protein